MDSGSTDFTVALVPTAMKAGVWISPCGVAMVPVLPRNSPPLADTCSADGLQVSARRFPTRNENSTGGLAALVQDWLARFQCASLPRLNLSGWALMWGS